MDIYGLMGDIELFRSVLDGFFKDWRGTYELLLSSGEYIFHQKKGACQFCELLRTTPEGEDLCKLCDQRHASQAAEKRCVQDYLCHAGLIDVVAPIFVNEKCIATIFCGQTRPKAKGDVIEARRRVSYLENRLGLELMELWEAARPVSKKRFDALKRKLTNLTEYLSKDWESKIRLERAEKDNALRAQEKEAVHTAFTWLSETFKTEKEFWDSLRNVIKRVQNQFGATYGAIVYIQGHEGMPTLKMVIDLPEQFTGRTYLGDKAIFEELLRKKESTVVSFDYSIPNTLCYDIADWLTCDDTSDYPDEVAYWPLYFSEEDSGILCLFSKKATDVSRSLSLREERFILEPFLSQISSAYKNYKLFEKEREYNILQSVWLQNVIHEVEQPLNGILGYAEQWDNVLFQIAEDWPDSSELLTYELVRNLSNGMQSILWMTLNASQVARNFFLLANDTKELDLTVCDNLSRILIACARDKQGQAKERGVIGPNVSADTIRPFDSRVQVNEHFFKQAIRNLIDNAVKYADIGTAVTVNAFAQDTNLIIRIIDFGLPILPGEEERIFVRSERSDLAKKSNIGGAGIGLAIASEIIHLHKGEIRTSPSQTIYFRGKKHYRTVFEVSLPLVGKVEVKDAK